MNRIAGGPGEAVLERMSEMMFVDVLRRYVDGLAPEQTGWLAGMRDPGVGRALALLHERPGEAWTLERLGAEAGLSRSVLHERFVHFIGQPPMQYLAQWRMQLAASRLRDTDAKIIEIALDVGYESEAAFSRAFRRRGRGTGRVASRTARDSQGKPIGHHHHVETGGQISWNPKGMARRHCWTKHSQVRAPMNGSHISC